MLSIAGALLGIVGTTVNHSLKMKDFKKILAAIQEQQRLQSQQHSELIMHQEHLKPSASIATTSNSSSQYEEDFSVTSEQSQKTEELIQRLQESQKLNSELSDLIEASKTSIEYKMKVNALMTVVITYGLIAISLPIIFKFLGE